MPTVAGTAQAMQAAPTALAGALAWRLSAMLLRGGPAALTVERG